MADANPATVLLEASKQQASKQARKQTARKQEASKETGREQANSEQEASVKCERGTNRCAYLSSRFGPENFTDGVPGDHFGIHFCTIGLHFEGLGLPGAPNGSRPGKTRCRPGKTRSPMRKREVFGTSAPCHWGPNFGTFSFKIPKKSFPGAFILQPVANTHFGVKITEKHMT